MLLFVVCCLLFVVCCLFVCHDMMAYITSSGSHVRDMGWQWPFPKVSNGMVAVDRREGFVVV